jgi:hypothetical protein
VPATAGLALVLCVIVTVGLGLFPDLLVGPADAGQPALVQVAEPAAAPALADAAP